MAEIVLGMGTSHGPMLSTPPEGWDLRVPDDRRSIHHFRGKTWTFEELVALRKDENLAAQITLDIWKARYAACRKAIDELARVFAEVKPDVLVLVGNDQMEIFDESVIPAFSVMWGPTIVNSEYTPERIENLPPGIGVSLEGHIPPGGATYPGAPELGERIIAEATAESFDVAAMKTFPKGETPHAFGFVYRQIMRDHPIPATPVVLNTFYPPNQPPVARCYALGKAIVRGVQSWKSDARVAIIASGGLSHFVIDEPVDQTFLEALKTGDVGPVCDLGEAIFQAGTSEMKNWLPLAAAMAELRFKPTIVDYIPCYRSEAGTGNAMGFVYWRP
jgi:hypothetical protein